MFPVKEMLVLFAYSLPTVLLNPLFWLVIALVAFQYRRVNSVSEAMFGTAYRSVMAQTVESVLFGLVGGIVGSLILVGLGVTISGVSIGALWVVALFLMLINPRFLCFSYSGGLISLSNLVFGWPKVHVPGLMGLVAVLHLMEGLLVYLSGNRGRAPVYLKGEDGRVVGAFLLQKFWPIPIIVLIIASGLDAGGAAIEMPNWWPLIKPPAELLTQGSMFFMVPVVAALGYGDFVTTSSPARKRTYSAVNLVLFSTILLLLAIVSVHSTAFRVLAALFAPAGHEFMIYLGRKRERRGKPLFIPPRRGVKVLDSVPNSLAAEMGIESDDTILAVNGMEVNSSRELKQALLLSGVFVTLDVRKSDGTVIELESQVRGHDRLGIITVPDENVEVYMDPFQKGPLESWFKSLLERFTNR